MDSSSHYMHVLTWLGAVLLIAVSVYLFVKLLLYSDRNKSPKRQKGGGNRVRAALGAKTVQTKAVEV